jgi:hypothetical protein
MPGIDNIKIALNFHSLIYTGERERERERDGGRRRGEGEGKEGEREKESRLNKSGSTLNVLSLWFLN